MPDNSDNSTYTLTEGQRLSIQQYVFVSMLAAFGVWDTCTKKVLRWELVPDRLHVVLFQSECGTVIIPFRKDLDERPYFGEVKGVRFDANGAPEESGRHSNIVAHSPSLAWNRDVLYLRPMTTWELERTISIIKGLVNGDPIKNISPPGETVPLAQASAGRSTEGGGMWSTYRAVFDRDQGACQMCGSRSNIHIDHKIPRAKGGSDGMENLWVLCETCNLSKGATI